MATRSLLPWALALIPLIIVVIAVVLVGRYSYEVLSRSYPGLPTSLASGVLRTTTEVASTVTVGALFYAAFIRPRKGTRRFDVAGGPGTDLAVVRWSALVWSLGSMLLIGVDAADIGGLSVGRLLTPGALLYLVQGSYLPGAWIFVTVLAFVLFCMANYVRTWQTTALMAVVALIGVLAPVVVTQVLVGPNHDWASDAAIFGTPAAAIWIGTTLLLAVRWVVDGRAPSEVAMTRWIRVSIGCSVVVAASQMVIAAVQISGFAHLGSVTAALFAVKFGLLAAAGILGVVTLRRRRATPSAVPVAAAAAILVAFLGVTVAITRVPPPVYFAPTSIAQTFLGYDITAAPTLLRLMFDWRLSILFTVLPAAGIGLYGWGMIRLRRRGDSWPVGRTVAWILGWAVVVLTTSSGLGRYSSVSFSLHMLLHMLLNMLGPMLLVLGGAVTLALRATTARRRGEPAGPHEWITAMLKWRFTHAIYNPLHVFLAFVGSYYVLYLTPIFGEALRYHWAHQVMNLDFLLVGYLFYGLVIGVDMPPRPLPHIGKLGLVLAAMPFHAFFGVAIMSQKDIIAGLFYSYIDAPWMTDLAHTQYVGGGIAWAAGEIPLVIVVVVLVTQWSRQDARQARRTDRHLDSGIDDSFADYNAMLQQLSKRGAPRVDAGFTAESDPS